MPNKRRIVTRMCVGCREMKPKVELIRVVKPPEGEVFLDPTGKKPGRGAYLCHDVECLKRAKKQKSLSRALEASLSDEIYVELEKRLEELADGDAR